MTEREKLIDNCEAFLSWRPTGKELAKLILADRKKNSISKEDFESLTIYGGSEIFDVAIWPQVKNNRDAMVELIKAVAKKTVAGCIEILKKKGLYNEAGIGESNDD